MSCHELIIKSKNGNYLVTIAIGKKTYSNWKKFALPFWKKYCLKYGIGIVVITNDLIDKKNKFWKKATWQKMLIGNYLLKEKINVTNVCYLDTDILINPFAPNIFSYHKTNKISLISESFNMPFDLEYVRKKVSFYRNQYYSKKYPLDSSIFMDIRNKYLFHNLEPQKDYACAGVIIFNLKKFSDIMYSWFFKYKKNIKTLTGGGDEPIFNYEMFKTKKVNLLNYKFQALWFYEMAMHYPFLYNLKNKKTKLVKDCIQASLSNNYFLHFAGSWHEGQMWKIKDIMIKKSDNKFYEKFNKYIKKKVFGKPAGRILP